MIKNMEVFCESIEDLRIYEIVQSVSSVNDFEDIYFLNVSFYGLESDSFDFKRGYRTEKKYYQDDVLFIKEYYEYTYTQDLRSIQRVDSKIIEFYQHDGSLGMRKTIPKKQKQKKLREINTTARVGRIDYLITAAEALEDGYNALPPQVDEPTVQYLISQNIVSPMFVSDVTTYHVFRNGLLAISQGIESLLKHYSQEISDYTAYGFMDFENSIVNESIPAFLQLLATPARPADSEFPNGLTVRQSIMYQLTGVIP